MFFFYYISWLAVVGVVGGYGYTLFRQNQLNK